MTEGEKLAGLAKELQDQVAIRKKVEAANKVLVTALQFYSAFDSSIDIDGGEIATTALEQAAELTK